MHNCLVALAAEANLSEESFNLTGDPLDNQFDIKWSGDFDTACARCHQLYSSLQLGKGRWKKQVVVGALQAEMQFFVSPDKKGAQVCKEILSKQLQAFVQALLPKQFWLKTATGALDG